MIEDESTGEYLRIIGQSLVQFATSVEEWSVSSSLSGGDPWIRVRNIARDLPQQGWKFHVSAYVATSHEILRRVLPTLYRERLAFKVIGSPRQLSDLNLGAGGRSQVGKFLTIYLSDSESAVNVASELVHLTQGLDGPKVSSDRGLTGSKVLFYRYGSFGGAVVRTPLGDYVPALETAHGERVADIVSRYEQPSWVEDPFRAAGISDEDDHVLVQPAHVGERYCLIAPIHRTARGGVFLALDTKLLTRCVVKFSESAEVAYGLGYSSSDLLRHEYEVLSALSCTGVAPVPFEFGQLSVGAYLAMEDIPGKTLSAVVQARANRGNPFTAKEVAKLGTELAELLDRIHESGYVYRDLKSSNVIVGQDGRLYLVDFELAHAHNECSLPLGRGTRGYMSPQQEAGEWPTVHDDIYGLGALLYFIVTAAEPSAAPRPSSLLDRSLVSLRPLVDSHLGSVIHRALEHRAEARFSSMSDLSDALSSVSEPCYFTSYEPVHSPREFDYERERYADLARRVGLALCAAGSRPPDGHGRVWSSTQPNLRHAVLSRDLGDGVSGIALALAYLYSEIPDEAFRVASVEGCQWLVGAKPIEGTPLPGLFVGDAGVALAFLRAGQLLSCDSFVEAALRRGVEVAALPHWSPDLYHGTAGRVLLHLPLWEETAASEQLEAAVHGGEVLMSGAERVGRGHMAWRIPDGYGSLSGQRWLGYAHGAAGIGHALICLYKATGDSKYKSAARKVGSWLESQAVMTASSAQGRAWPASADQDLLSTPVWCHGSGGIGRFFLAAAAVDAIPGAMAVAAAAAVSVAEARWIGPTQCHGLAGNIEFLLDMYIASGSSIYLDEAMALARVLETFLVDDFEGLALLAGGGATLLPGYIVGYAGIATCLLRLSTLGRLPKLLDP